VQEFKGDFALLNLAGEDVKDDETAALKDVVLHGNAQFVTPWKVYNGTLSLT
jgi:hypothetical protein